MKKSSAASIAAVFGLSLAALLVSHKPAAAAIVCNAEGQCWHVAHPYAYPPAYGLVVHPNNWRWGPGAHYVWREHPGRGYWRGGVWVSF
jgi:hypothetical protein